MRSWMLPRHRVASQVAKCIQSGITHVAAVDNSLQQAHCQLLVMWHVQLKDAHAILVGFSYVLDAGTTRCAQRIWKIQLLRHFRNQ